MSADKRLAAIERGLNGIERKVLAAVPMQEAWSAKAIQQELYRSGRPVETKVLIGCLHGLCEVGLVKSPAAGEYSRTPIAPTKPSPATLAKPAEKKTMTLPATTTHPAIKQSTKPATLASDGPRTDLMADLAEQAASLRRKADELDALALVVGEREQEHKDELGKLYQLRALLKGI